MQCFISYSHKDAEQVQRLRQQLKFLQRHVTIWTDQEIKAGDSWDPLIQQKLKKADMILLCVSANFYWSRYIETVELQHAKARHLDGTAVIIPVILKDCLWQSDDFLGNLNAVPRNGRAIQLWNPRDTGYADAARGIEDRLKAMPASGAAP